MVYPSASMMTSGIGDRKGETKQAERRTPSLRGRGSAYPHSATGDEGAPEDRDPHCQIALKLAAPRMVAIGTSRPKLMSASMSDFG